MIDFSKINSFDAGQRESFEELICVLAKREQPAGGIDFQRIEGSGGDGGVEAIWLLNDDRTIGYQAKYFLSLDSSKWHQIDKSVRRALDVRPELKRYVVALPCNLTGKKEYPGRGFSGWEKWQALVTKWSECAKVRGIKVSFDLWTATDITDRLLKEENTSLQRHWFGGDVLNDAWFRNHIILAVKTLDDRFNPDDHVEVSIEAMFDAIVRGPLIMKHISDGFTEFAKTRVPNTSYANAHAPDQDILAQANSAQTELLSLQMSLSEDLSKPWNIEPIKAEVERLKSSTGYLSGYFYSIDRKSVAQEDKHKIDADLRRIRELSAAAYSLGNLLDDRLLVVESSKCALVYGPAGAGKSHILGQIAEQRVSEGAPTILLLGQDFSNADLWQQMGTQLGLESRSAEAILGVINAAAERKGVRVLLLIDAINEGVGSQFWRQRLPRLLEVLKDYANLAVILSCREEYVQHAIPASLNDDLPRLKINGFTTPEEFESAALTYLDKKGIARPNTPWISQEFTNPLFMKSASEAIHANGDTEFPLGLHGISNLMSFYLDSLSWRTGINNIGPAQLASPIKRVVGKFAENMARAGNDFIDLDEASTLAAHCFGEMQPPVGQSWFQVLIDTSLFRLDPPPYSEEADPLNPSSDLVRFAFQRFQDHLMAQSLVDRVDPEHASMAFSKDGPLNFLCHDGMPGGGLHLGFAGLIGSLSTIYPEKLGIEFASTVPDWENVWDILQSAFVESCKWRRTDAFTDATLELFNKLDEGCVDRFGLLLEVSMTVDHPWNALFLHSWLKDQALPERDSFWTLWINWSSRDEGSQAERIVSWSLACLDKRADVKHLELASIVLAWMLSSSRQSLRDRASKALTTVFLKQADVFEFLLDKFFDCNDPYVIERIYAAAFGACCIDQKPERLNSYARKVFEKVFSQGNPPVALLTRDYALGIVELAVNSEVLSNDVQLDKCFPPFSSDPPDFDLNEADVEQLAEDRGGKQIFRSASSEWGDFGKYSIPGRVRSFLTTPLSEPAPPSNEERKKLFFEEVIKPHSDRVEALDSFEEHSNFTEDWIIYILKDKMGEEKAKEEANAHKERQDAARKKLEELLTAEEAESLSEEYFRDGKCYEKYESVNVQQCRLWITKRAYELGWKAELFPEDDAHTSYSPYHNDVERIGKKYQRIALDEVQARLADNYWTVSGWAEEPCVYRYSHHDFRRNLEPTILPNDSNNTESEDRPNDWMFEPVIKLPKVTEEKLKEWPFKQDPTKTMGKNLVRVDEDGNRWLVLYEFGLDWKRYDEPAPGNHGLQNQEFRFLYCIFLKGGAVEKFIEFIKTDQQLHVDWFKPEYYTDGPYLREAFWRDTWKCEKFSSCHQNAPKECVYGIPVAGYCWESHLDKSLPNGFRAFIPQMWFAKELGIHMSQDNIQSWVDEEESAVIQTREASDHQTGVIIDEAALTEYSQKFDIDPVWIMVAERHTWSMGSNRESYRRRSEGAAWCKGGSWKQVGWNKDTRR